MAGKSRRDADDLGESRRRRLAAAVEPLELRTLLSVSITQQISPVTVASGGAGATLDLSQNFTDPQTTGTFVEFQTSLGNVEVQLFNQSTPLTVANFLQYVNGDLYNNTIIDRSVGGFVVQGGGYHADGTAITTFPPVQNEPGISNTAGTIAMAKTDGEPDSATSQFFFNVGDNSQVLDNENGGFTVFGEVVNGLNVVDAINNLTTTSATLGSHGFPSLPLLSASGGTQASNLVQVTSVTTIPTPQITITAVSDNTRLLTTSVNGESLSLDPVAGESGYAHVTVTATGPSGTSVTQVVRVHIVGAQTIDVPLGAGNRRSVSYTDQTANAATVTYSGPGSAVAQFSGSSLFVRNGRVHGQGITFDSFTATGSTAASSLIVNGPASAARTVSIGDITFNGSAGNIRLHHALLVGDMSVSGAVRHLTVDNAEDGSISIGAGSPIEVSAGSFVSESLTSLAPISQLDGAEWINQAIDTGISAPSIGTLKFAGSFTPGLTLDGGGSQLLKSIRVVGFIGGKWTVPGKLPKLNIRGIAEDFDATFTDPIKSLNLPLGFGGDLTVPSIGNLRAGSMTDAVLTLTDAFAAKRKDLGRLKVTGEIDQSAVISTGNVGPISARGIFLSSLFAGVGSVESGGNLPTVTSDFTSNASIESVTTRGSTAKAAGFLGSDIAAWTLGNLQLGRTTISNEETGFGISAHTIAGLHTFDQSKKQNFSFGHLTSATTLAKLIARRKLTLGDFQINIV